MISILRWIFFIPAAALACALATFVVYTVMLMGMYMFEFGRLGWINFIAHVGGCPSLDMTWFRAAQLYGTNGFAIGAVLVYVGAIVAPSHKKLVAFIVASVAIILSVGAIAISVLVPPPHWKGAWLWVCTGFGAGLMAYLGQDGKISFDKSWKELLK